MMALLLVTIAVLILSGIASLFAGRSPRAASGIGAGGAVLAALIGVPPSLRVLLGAPEESLRRAWEVPGGAFYVALDPLSALFLILILGLAALAAVYGAEYLYPHRARHSLGPPWFFFNLLVAGMVLVVLARNALLFLMAWETMSLASFFLVTFESERKDARDAGWTYLVATHLGTAFLLVLFVLLGRGSGSLDFDQFGGAGGAAPAAAGTLFLLALVGFGTKAGFMPLHVWLPEAHPAAPSHVSALMSGVMIKTGIYGLLRTLTFLGPPPAWWGPLLIAVGLGSGLLGVLFALAQRDLKRALAYSSVENIGIITLGLGAGILGMSTSSPTLVVLGFGGALFHVLNHALFKGLLFLAAGAVAHGTGTRDLEELGGLLKRMPWVGNAFIVGAIAIAGLPPLNGFAGEFLIYLGAFRGSAMLVPVSAALLVLLIAGLALIGGLALACFTRLAGIAFLGAPRSARVAEAHEPGWAMRAPIVLLAASCLVVGVFPGRVLLLLAGPIAGVTGLSPSSVATALAAPARSLAAISLAAGAFLALVAGLFLLRRRLLAGREVTHAPTWDCGYDRPTARMQYTASSFARPLTEMFNFVLRVRRRGNPPEGFFPRESSLATETPDIGRERLFRPAFAATGWGLARFRWIQHGRLHLYVLYIVLTLCILLVWRMP